MMALSSSARNPMDSTRSSSVADPPLEGDHLLVAGLHLPLHPEQPGNREAPDVGVEHAHGQPAAGQGHGQVDGDRALPTPPLPEATAITRVVVGDVGRRRRVPGQKAGPGHDRLALLGVHDPGGDRHPAARRAGPDSAVSTSFCRSGSGAGSRPR